MRDRNKWLCAALAGLTLAASTPRAEACGCFAPPSPMTPVVQAGERILFMHDGSTVTAYIQIQYQGAANEFGWLVPLPSVPTLELGTDELFSKLQAQTNPQYTITTNRIFCGGGSSSYTHSSNGCGGDFFGASSDNAASYDLGAFASDLGASNPSPVVVQSSIGPYDYAVLKADDQTEMLDWLNANRYFVPDATGAAVAPYIHPGGYFLALKLKAGEAAGDVVPVVLKYASDLPMIPITLTSVGAIPDMGILVWFLGDSRAIPRNYYHVELDEMPIWENLTGYPAAVIRAIHEAPSRHAFITEYAGPSSIMVGQLDAPGRFGDLDVLREIKDPGDYLQYLYGHGYPISTALFAILEKYLPEPAQLRASGVSENQFYMNWDSFMSQLFDPDAGTSAPFFDRNALTDELEERIVKPTLAAGKIFSTRPYLTRMFTALSPEDMNSDPVFSENPDLPPVPTLHSATLTIPCRGDAWLTTESKRQEQWISSLPPSKSYPGAEKIELLREAGPPQIVTDNTAAINALLGPVDTGSGSASVPKADDGGGCNLRRSAAGGTLGTFLLVAAAILVARRRREVG